jgi:hypothetical protein
VDITITLNLEGLFVDFFGVALGILNRKWCATIRTAGYILFKMLGPADYGTEL